MSYTWTVVDEVELIGPGHRRVADAIHVGYWTPELVRWTDVNGYEEKQDLQMYNWVDGVKVTGVEVNASPVLCITKQLIGHEDLTVSVTGLLGVPSGYVTSGDVVLTGYIRDWQYNQAIYRRYYATGGGTYEYEFTIPAHTKPGKVYKLPSKRLYKLTDVNVTPQRVDQPVTDIRFYALADNGSKLLYTLNWNKVFEYGRENLYSAFGHPNKCPRCKGSGYVAIETDTCIQCSGYGFHGPNATGYYQIQRGREFGLTQESGESDETFRNKIWAMTWAQNLVPTQEEIQKYYGHFARVENNEVEITRAYRSQGATGIEVIVDLYLPQQIPLAVFDEGDYIWTRMAERIEPGAVQIRFSFAIQAFTGSLDFEDMVSHYRSGYIAGVYTGLILDPHTYGFDQLQTTLDTFGGQWYNNWGGDYFFINLLPTGLGGLVHKSGDDAESGFQMLSGDTYTWQSGLLTGHAWLEWAEPASGNAQGGIWDTGGNGIIISEFYDINNSGTYYWDNFWSSGVGAQGIQY